MRAAVLRNTGDDKLEIVDDVELGPVGPGEVKVKIHATGVCHSDVSGMNGTIPQPAPFVPGPRGRRRRQRGGRGRHQRQARRPRDHRLERALRHAASSASTASSRTCASTCRWPRSGAMHFSQGGTPIFGFAGSGTWAEEMIMPQQGVVKIDPETPHEIASLVGCGVMTGVGAALNTAKVTPGLVGRRLRLRRRRHLGHPGRPGRRCRPRSWPSTSSTRSSRTPSASGPPTRSSPTTSTSAKASITGGDGFDYAFEAIGLPADDAGRLRRHPPRRHHLRHRRGRHGQDGLRSTPSSCSTTRRRSRARTTARPTCAATSTGCSTCGSTAASTSRA